MKAIEFVDEPGDLIDWSNTLIIVTSDHGNSFLRTNTAMTPALGDLPTQEEDDGSCDAEYCGDYVYPDGDVFYGSGGHTNELVSVYAKGYAAEELFSKYEGDFYSDVTTKVIDNTHIFHVMADFFEVTHAQ